MENNLVIPQHIAIIMDGNGRWAAKHSLERCEGHRMGAEALKNLIGSMKDLPASIWVMAATAPSTLCGSQPKARI